MKYQRFNPLPSQKQGETSTFEPVSAYCGVSIRSPHKSKGRPLSFKVKSRCVLRFNPLPSQKQGETNLVQHTKPRSRVSIRSPHKSKGRLMRGYSPEALLAVSIRSPHKSKGRQPHIRRGGKRRGVSIRSPHKSKGRPSMDVLAVPRFEFQSAPLTKARGDGCPFRRSRGLRCFNPLPSQKQGETPCFSLLQRSISVSIRSPHKSKGRHQPVRRPQLSCRVSIRSPHKSKGRLLTKESLEQMFRFQSAPLTKARGDK